MQLTEFYTVIKTKVLVRFHSCGLIGEFLKRVDVFKNYCD